MSPDEIKTETTPIPIVNVAIVGTGETAHPMPQGTVAVTPDHLPNVVVTVIGPVQAISVRFINTFLTVLIGLVTASMTPIGGKLLYTHDFMRMIWLCSSLALPGAVVGLIKDLITVFGRLERKYPLATGSV